MTWPHDLKPFLGLFALDFVASPSIIVDHGVASGITHEYTREIAAWCAELNEHLKVLAADAGIELQLMGGNGASLRLDAAAQRGSSDNDYLTTASEADVEALAGRLGESFAVLPEPLMRPKRISAEGKLPLPLVSFLLSVPSLTVGNRETLEAKIEFHLEEELPPGESVTGEPFAVGQRLTSEVPALPYQIGLKLIVLDDPPVGIPLERRDAIPQQLHDIDFLVELIEQPGDWAALGPYLRQRYEKERRYQRLRPEEEAPWQGIRRRLDAWATCDTDDELWRIINKFQTAQLGKATRRPPGEWRARCRRLAVICACLQDADPASAYGDVLKAEARIPAALAGRPARPVRAALGSVMGEAYEPIRKQLNAYAARATFWEALGISQDVTATLSTVQDALDTVSL